MEKDKPRRASNIVINEAISEIQQGTHEINGVLAQARGGPLSKSSKKDLGRRVKVLRETAKSAEEVFRFWTQELAGQETGPSAIDRTKHASLRARFEAEVSALEQCIARVTRALKQRRVTNTEHESPREQNGEGDKIEAAPDADGEACRESTTEPVVMARPVMAKPVMAKPVIAKPVISKPVVTPRAEEDTSEPISEVHAGPLNEVIAIACAGVGAVLGSPPSFVPAYLRDPEPTSEACEAAIVTSQNCAESQSSGAAPPQGKASSFGAPEAAESKFSSVGAASALQQMWKQEEKVANTLQQMWDEEEQTLDISQSEFVEEVWICDGESDGTLFTARRPERKIKAKGLHPVMKCLLWITLTSLGYMIYVNARFLAVNLVPPSPYFVMRNYKPPKDMHPVKQSLLLKIGEIRNQKKQVQS